MNDPASALLSVRGDARRLVAPDYVVLDTALTSSRQSKPDALRTVASALDRLTADLASRGGVALSGQTERRPLTWSAWSATTRVEHDHNKKTGRYEPTGRVVASVAVSVTLRALELLDALSAVLAGHESLNVDRVSWHVDWDNPAWPEVRAAAIQAAIRKGRDYAAALGGSLLNVEHVADAGLLGGGETGGYRFAPTAATLTAHGGAEPGTPSLDPVPQELSASIEARFTSTGVSVTER